MRQLMGHKHSVNIQNIACPRADRLSVKADRTRSRGKISQGADGEHDGNRDACSTHRALSEFTTTRKKKKKKKEKEEFRENQAYRTTRLQESNGRE